MDNSNVIFVYGGKGGVGKSTISVNLAYSLSQLNFKVALLDMDFSGPSVPRMISKIKKKDPYIEGIKVFPGQYGKVDVLSVGFFVDIQDLFFLNGKYLEGALNQLVFNNDYSKYDFVIVDLPPGFSELHRQLFTNLKGNLLLVSTPQNLSYDDLVRSVNIFENLDLNVIGLVENMAYFTCSNCNSKNNLFEDKLYSKLNKKIEILFSFPYENNLNLNNNSGIPFVLENEGSKINNMFLNLSKSVINKLDKNAS